MIFPEPIDVTRTNDYLRATPAKLTSHPYSLGWLFEGKVSAEQLPKASGTGPDSRAGDPRLDAGRGRADLALPSRPVCRGRRGRGDPDDGWRHGPARHRAAPGSRGRSWSCSMSFSRSRRRGMVSVLRREVLVRRGSGRDAGHRMAGLSARALQEDRSADPVQPQGPHRRKGRPDLRRLPLHRGRTAASPAFRGSSSARQCHAEPQGKTADEKVLVEKYVAPKREIPWLVYARQPENAHFSHAPHLAAAKIACERCHGPHGSSESLRPFELNRISGYSRDIWGHRISGIRTGQPDGMKMSDCSPLPRRARRRGQLPHVPQVNKGIASWPGRNLPDDIC